MKNDWFVGGVHFHQIKCIGKAKEINYVTVVRIRGKNFGIPTYPSKHRLNNKKCKQLVLFYKEMGWLKK